MRRLHLFEIEDQAWCPRTLRDALTDCLRLGIAVTRLYAPITQPLARAIQRTGARRVIDLCSGGGGPWPWLQPALSKAGTEVTVCLSDKYPNLNAFQRAKQAANGAIGFEPAAVDAVRVPAHLEGFRTLFSSFHHFRPSEARAILGDAVRQRQGICVAEGVHRSLGAVMRLLPAPLAVLVLTPFVRPFRWSRLFWAYVLPVVPLAVLFDGMVSCLRAYTLEELREMTREFDGQNYHWEIGRVTNEGYMPITYLIGIPKFGLVR